MDADEALNVLSVVAKDLERAEELLTAIRDHWIVGDIPPELMRRAGVFLLRNV